ncbi:MAG: glycosyltransferase family 2 protein [Candidatus Margulisiibacteriota bacterium]
MGSKVFVIMPAYNAERTLEKTYCDIPRDYVHTIILGDDCSSDNTVAIAERLRIQTHKTPRNLGYGGNQKMLYKKALEQGADAVVMIHPDWQYDATLIPEMVEPIIKGKYDVMMGSRILGGGALSGGMPMYKYVSNRFLTFIENLCFGLKLSEYHTGMRAYSRKVLETIPFDNNSDDFVFDSEVLAQVARAKFRVGEISIPCRYFPEASSVNFKRSLKYGLETLGVCARYLLNRV